MSILDKMSKQYENIQKSKIKTILFWIGVLLVLSLIGAIVEILKSTINGSLSNMGITHNFITIVLVCLSILLHYLSSKYTTDERMHNVLIKSRNISIVIIIVIAGMFGSGIDDVVFFRY